MLKNTLLAITDGQYCFYQFFGSDMDMYKVFLLIACDFLNETNILHKYVSPALKFHLKGYFLELTFKNSRVVSNRTIYLTNMNSRFSRYHCCLQYIGIWVLFYCLFCLWQDFFACLRFFGSHFFFHLYIHNQTSSM